MFSVIDVHEAADEKLYVEDVFSAFTYTGNGSTQSIVNGIDLAGKGGMVWIKGRSGATDHALYDTDRGTTKDLVSNATSAETTQSTGLTAFNADGFSLGSLAKLNTSTATYIGWTFRKAKKFFDVKTYTGNGVAGRQIAHDLGVAPGMIVVKQTNGTQGWLVYHRSTSGSNFLVLNSTGAMVTDSSVWNDTNATDAVFTVGTGANQSSAQYVAYIFAHDDSADGIIQCGTFAPDGSGNVTVNLGWEPQYILYKNSSATGNWQIGDSARGLTTGNDQRLAANTSDAEDTANVANPTGNGFNIVSGPAGGTYVYLAIRKGLMRKPTDASKVFDLVSRTGNGGTAAIVSSTIKTGVDLIIAKKRSSGTARSHMWSDRTRGTDSQLASDSTGGEATSTLGVRSFNMDGVGLGSLNTVNANSDIYINEMFKQARGFFDIVGYTGTGAARTVPHNLGAVPELMIVKNRSAVFSWPVYYGDPLSALVLSATQATVANSIFWNNTFPTSSEFTVGSAGNMNGNGNNMIAYLFASCPGVSKIGTYTGTGAAQNIDCGFAAGARFVMIKRIDSTGNWYYFDTVRGIISGNDPYLLFDSTAAESAAADLINPYSSGFTAQSPFSVNSATYLFLAIA